MPSIKDQSTVEAIAQDFTNTGRDKTATLRRIGYSESYCTTLGVGVVYSNIRIIDAIATLDAKLAVKLELTRAGQHLKLESARQHAKDKGLPAAEISSIREQNEMLGYHRDKAPNSEREASLLASMSAEELIIVEMVVRARTRELSIGRPVIDAEAHDPGQDDGAC